MYVYTIYPLSLSPSVCFCILYLLYHYRDQISISRSVVRGGFFLKKKKIKFQPIDFVVRSTCLPIDSKGVRRGVFR